MEYNIDEPFESFSSRDHEKVETLGLLEDCWFFDNMFFDRKTRMLRCNSDPCPSSDFGQEMLVKKSYGEDDLSTRKLQEDDDGGFVRPNLIRTPSLPPCLGKEEESQEKGSNHRMSKLTQQTSQKKLLQTPNQLPTCIEMKEGIQEKESDDSGRSKLSGKSTRRNLLRTPSLPPGIGREEVIQGKESDDPRMSKYTRQALPNLPRHKGMIQSTSIPRYRPPRNQEVEARSQFQNHTRLRKSLSDLEIEEVQGFRDLGFTFDKDLSPRVVDILPGLQEKKHGDLEEEDNKVRRPYLSEAWLAETCAPPIPTWAAKGSAEDMKAQIKFWARNVASNMRQEC